MRPKIGQVVDVCEKIGGVICEKKGIITCIFPGAGSAGYDVNVIVDTEDDAKRIFYKHIPLCENKGFDSHVPGCAYLIEEEKENLIPGGHVHFVDPETENKNYPLLCATTSVKVMRSYDYCHFEVCLSSEVQTTEHVDDLRKEAAKLVDKAVSQYQQAKDFEQWKIDSSCKLNRLKKEADKIFQINENERTPRQKAILKLHNDINYQMSVQYSYDNDFEFDDYGDNWESWEDENCESWEDD